MNKALLGKWLWRLRGEGGSLWIEVVAAQYEVSTGGWETGGPAYRISRL